MGTVIIFYRREPLVTVVNVPLHVRENAVLEAYANVYGFNPENLSAVWVREGIPFSSLRIK